MALESFENEDMVFKDKYRNLKRKLKFLIYVKENTYLLWNFWFIKFFKLGKWMFFYGNT